MNKDLENGFYWLTFRTTNKKTVGHYCKEFDSWQIIGDDRDISTCDIEQSFYIVNNVK